MKWELKEPIQGDIIRVKVGSIHHYGIYISDEEVIQFGLSPILRSGVPDSEITVCSSHIDDFLNDGFLEIGTVEKKDKKRFPAKKTVALAKSRLGEKGYNILYNNCEHFANECFFGEKYSSQTDDVRNMFKNLPIVDVYVAKIPDDLKVAKVYPKSRHLEIKSVSNVSVKKQKYAVWKLLEYALNRTFGKKISQLTFNKLDCGKWTCDDYEFSLSHSDDTVAVVVSRAPVGVDIEPLEPLKADLSGKILSYGELAEYEKLSLPEKLLYVINAWTKKESLFKSLRKTGLTENEIKNLDGTVYQKVISLNEKNYSLSVATATPDKVRLHEGIDLLKV